MEKNKQDIHDRIYKFVLTVLNEVKKVPRTTENIVLIKQVIRSAGSIGANAAETDGAESKQEFIHKFTIAKKEAKERVLQMLDLLVMYLTNYPEALDERMNRAQMTWKRI